MRRLVVVNTFLKGKSSSRKIIGIYFPLIFLFLFTFSIQPSQSATLFSDDFSSGNYNNWTLPSGSGATFTKVSGNSIKVWVDGTQYIDVTDNTYSSGTIGLGSTHVEAGFDDIVVTDSTSSSAPSFTKIGSLPITVDGLTSIFDPATKSLYLFPNWPNYYNQVYRTTHDASDSLSWSQITTGPNNWNYWGRPEVLPGVAVYFTGAFYQGSTIYLANINSNGTLGSWRTTTNMLNQYWARALHQSQIYNGKFYINGGWQSDYGPNYDDIIAATVNSDGTLGNFSRVGTLPYQVLGHSTYLANNKMYFVHGDKIQIANINSDGSIGSFVSQTYPISHGNYGTRGIVIIDNYLVVNDREKTHIFQLNSSGNITGLLYTINNPVEFNERYVYVNNNKVYILDRSGVYRLDGLGGSVSQYTLSVMKTGTGSGTVTSNPAGINCGSTCSATFNQNTQVTLTATAGSNSTFSGWSGDCSGSSTTCTVTMNSAKNVTAMFNVTQCSYSINPSSASFASNGGSGSVAVTASPSGCSGSWTAVSNVSWITITSGSSGTGNGTVSYSVSQNTTTSSRTGTITIAGQTHTVTQTGQGYVSVSQLSVPSTVTLGQDFTVQFTLKEVAGTSRTFESIALAILRADGSTLFDCKIWSNVSVSGYGSWQNNATCNIYTTNPTGTYKAIVRGKVAGGNWFDFDTTGTGVNPISFTASSQCSYSINPSTNANIPSTGGTYSVAVTATPTGCSGSWTAVSNANWITITSVSSGTGNGTVSYSVSQNTTTSSRTGTIMIGGQTHTVTQAGIQQYTLSVTKTGTGSGTVTSNPAGIDCGSTCSATFNQNTQVTLTATAGSNSTFLGWSGDCSGSSTTCTVTMNSAKNVTAMFNVTQCSYSINPSSASFASNGGSGSVAVTVSPSGCSGSWTAVSNVSWITILSGSSGTGNGTVSYSVSQNTTTSLRTGTITIGGQTHTVTQAGMQQYNLSVTKAGTGSGTVTSNPAGIDCGSNCVGSFSAGSNVTLIATNFVGSTFDGWSGDCVICGSNSSCTINMNSQKECRVLFNRTQCTYNINATNRSCPATGGNGTITVNASSFNCQWTSLSDSNWLIVNPVNGTGNGVVNYICEANTSVSTRIGTITIAGQSIQITQEGQMQQTSASRVLPARYTIGQSIDVMITVVPPSGTQVYAVEETPPVGWSITDINESGAYTNGKVRWVFFDGNVRTLSYKATPHSGMVGVATFNGTVMFNQTTVNIGGNTTILSDQGQVTRMPVYRFYNSYTGGHFFTENPDEKNYVINELPEFRWESDGAFYIFRMSESEAFPVYRLYNTYGVGHYYTIDEIDRDAKVSEGYSVERIGFYAHKTQVGNAKPVYYFNRPAHTNNGREAWFYTISQAEKELIISTMPVWVYKGIAFYAYDN